MKKLLFLLLIFAFVLGCGTEPNPTIVEHIDISKFEFPESRTFNMGFTPWPYEFTDTASNETYSLITEHSDFVVHHLDGGVPWSEAFANEPYNQHVLDEIAKRKSKSSKTNKVYLAVTFLSMMRNSVAGYWGLEENMALPEYWKNKEFDDSELIEAYLNYCRFMIAEFEPDYFAYGIELDAELREEDPEFDKMIYFISKIYPVLKKEYPDLPIFVTIVDESPNDNFEIKKNSAKRILDYSDYLALSSYPFWNISGKWGTTSDPKEIPSDWYSKIKTLAPEKPFAIAETGYIAETLSLPKYGLNIEGNEEWQAEYIHWFFQEMNKNDAEFVAWFTIRDYDQGWEFLNLMGFDEFFKTWKDTGLIDGGGNPRKSLAVWDKWLELKKE